MEINFSSLVKKEWHYGNQRKVKINLREKSNILEIFKLHTFY